MDGPSSPTSEASSAPSSPISTIIPNVRSVVGVGIGIGIGMGFVVGIGPNRVRQAASRFVVAFVATAVMSIGATIAADVRDFVAALDVLASFVSHQPERLPLAI